MGSRLGNLAQIMEALNGVPDYQESVSTSTTTAKNATALIGGRTVIIQSDVDCFFKVGGSTVTCAASTSMKLLADTERFLTLRSTDTHIASILATGTGTLKIFYAV